MCLWERELTKDVYIDTSSINYKLRHPLVHPYLDVRFAKKTSSDLVKNDGEESMGVVKEAATSRFRVRIQQPPCLLMKTSKSPKF